MTMPLDDRGLLLGDGLFETILAKNGWLALWDEHLARMTAGCAVLGLPAPDPDQAARLCDAAIDSAGLGQSRAAVRLTLTAGSGGRGLDRPADPAPRLFATAALSEKPVGPVRLVTATVRRNAQSPASRLKTLSYLDNVLARREAGGDEALMLNTAGEVACAAAANLFWIAGGVLHTPALACGVLDGVFRRWVIGAAKAQDIGLREVQAPRADLDAAEGMFLTNSLIGVRAVSALDGRAVADHPMTGQIAAALGAIS